MGIFYLRYIIGSLIGLFQTLLLVRALLSWFPVSSGIYDFLHLVTEPIIMPVRILFDKMGIDVSMPIDLPFLVTYILLSVISSALL